MDAESQPGATGGEGERSLPGVTGPEEMTETIVLLSDAENDEMDYESNILSECEDDPMPTVKKENTPSRTSSAEKSVPASEGSNQLPARPECPPTDGSNSSGSSNNGPSGGGSGSGRPRARKENVANPEEPPKTGDSNIFKKLGIVDINFPTVNLDSGRIAKIGANLLRLLVKLHAEGNSFALKVMDATAKDAGLLIACYNKESASFVEDNLHELCPVAVASGKKDDCRLKIVEADDMKACVQVVGFISNNVIRESEVIGMLKAANPEQKFDTTRWSLIRAGRKNNRGFMIVLNIDHGSFKKMKKSGMKLWFGFKRVYLKHNGPEGSRSS